MSSGKVHEAIGVVTAGALYLGVQTLVMKNFVPVDFALIVGGSAVGSLLPDIDSKKSISSQWFHKIVCSISVIAVLMAVVKLIMKDSVQIDLIKFISSFFLIGDYFVNSYIGLFLFIVFVVVGKLSKHRGFTHRVLGTSIFGAIVIVTFTKYVAFGLLIGYLAHLVADSTTPAGLKFFELKTPFN